MTTRWPSTTRPVGEERELVRSSLHIDWDVGWGTFTSLTGYLEAPIRVPCPDSNQTSDGTVPFYYLPESLNPGMTVTILNAVPDDDQHRRRDDRVEPGVAFQQPLRIKPLRFDVGAYWYDVEGGRRFYPLDVHVAPISKPAAAQILPD